MPALQTAGRSETGPIRVTNDDVIVGSERLALVADGMGGSPGGAVAARIAAEIVPATFTGRSIDELAAAVRAANWAISKQASDHADLAGMGTTVCAAGLLDDGWLAVVHVGDTRAYLWHAGELTLLTRDHTVTAELVARSELDPEDASAHPYFGVLTRVLGVAPEVAVDGARHRVVPGDRLVLCSDGLVNEVGDDEIAAEVAGGPDGADLSVVVDRLIDRALVRGGRDNVSIVVAEIAE